MVVEIPYAHIGSLNLRAKDIITSVAHQLFPGERLRLVDDPQSPLFDPKKIVDYPNGRELLLAQMARMFDKLPGVPDDFLFLDIETHNAEKRWDMPVWDFFRLGQYTWGEGEVHLTTDLSEVIEQIIKARKVFAHNGHSFDFSVLLGTEALDLTMQQVLFDTWVHAEVHLPCPTSYIHANGHHYKNNVSPRQFMAWYGLNNMAYQLGVEGKMGDLKTLAAEYNPPKTAKDDLDLGLIPVDDPAFLEYARQDVVVLRELVRSMIYLFPVTPYDWKNQKAAAIDAQMVRNGVRVNIPLVQERAKADEKNKQDTLKLLVEEYDFPTEGKSPWSSKLGKEAIRRILADHGITPENSDWKRTDKGNLSFSGETLISLTEGTEVESLGTAIAALSGTRTLAEQTLRFLCSDGKVHPNIDGIQRSGRRSVTEPALTTWGSRSEQGQKDKAFFIPNDGYAMVSADLSNADARAVAFMSGDKNRAKWFEPGADSHEIVGRLMFGDEVYDSDPKKYRTMAKPLNHGSAYGAQPKKLAKAAGVPYEVAVHYANVIKEHYPDVIRWQDRVRAEGAEGWVTNEWGRKMLVTGSAYTQSPALLGQSSTTEIIYDGLIKLYTINREALLHVLFPVHDELIYEEPIGDRTFSRDIARAMKQTIKGITFELSTGDQASNWCEATH